ncbi:MAG: helix-turn-helix transcriptional regulator [Gordonibacter sp.]|uniref:helix-turn-helix transcriptional regulator n=1 Tax=Gordonibacter sp. TaxID=1968902 RepID=UPI002FC7CB32
MNFCITGLSSLFCAWLASVKRWASSRGGLRQEDLAARCGVSRQTIIAIENDKYDPTLALAMRLARELGVAVEELFCLD